MQITSHDDDCPVLLEWDNHCTCQPLKSVSKPILRESTASRAAKAERERIITLLESGETIHAEHDGRGIYGEELRQKLQP